MAGLRAIEARLADKEALGPSELDQIARRAAGLVSSARASLRQAEAAVDELEAVSGRGGKDTRYAGTHDN